MPSEIVGELIVGAVELALEVGGEAASKEKKPGCGCFFLIMLLLSAIGFGVYLYYK